MNNYKRVFLWTLIVIWSILLFFVFFNDVWLKSSAQVQNILWHGIDQDRELWWIDVDPDTIELDIELEQDNVVIESFDINDLKRWLWNPSLDQLLPLYNRQKTPEVLRYIIQKAIDMYEFEFALQLLSEQTIDIALDVVWIDTYIYLMFNQDILDYGRINRIKEVLQTMFNSGYITQTQLDHYNWLVALSRWDVENRYYFLEQVWDDKNFISRKNDTQEMIQKYNSFQDVPEYYLKALLGSMVYSRQYLRVAQKIWSDIIYQGNGYILTHQLVWYSSLLLKDYSQSMESLRRLLENDSSSRARYTYLLGIALYEQEDYAQAVFHFQSLSESEYWLDWQKYLFLIYQQIWDRDRLARLMSSIIKRWNLTNQEYLTFFDELFWNNWAETQNYIDKMNDDIDQLMENCYTQVSEKQICMYGKAWLFYQLWQYDTAYTYLTSVVNSVYNARVFSHLGDISSRLWNEVLAKKRYVRALRLSDSDQLSLQIENTLRNIMNN